MIKVFYHCYLVNNWQEVVNEQIGCLIKSKLYDACTDITVTVSSNKANLSILKDILKPYPKFVVTTTEPINRNKEERLALTEIYNFSNTNSHNTPILYFHTKGISHKEPPLSIHTSNWRQLLNYYNIIHWKDCITLLTEFKCNLCGIIYHYRTVNNKQTGYFDGNYWWTTSHYVKQLPNPDTLPYNRADNEYWVTMAPTKTIFSLFQTAYDLYYTSIPQKAYHWNGSLRGVLIKELPDKTLYKEYLLKKNGNSLAYKACK